MNVKQKIKINENAVSGYVQVCKLFIHFKKSYALDRSGDFVTSFISFVNP
jgi:hypothetical protein